MRKTKLLLTLFSILLVLFFTACNKGKTNSSIASLEQDKSVKVLCTTGMVQDLVSAIGQNQIRVHTLIKPQVDPHAYELVKGDGEKFAYADLVFYNGLGLEHSPHIYKQLKEHPKSYALGDYIIAKSPNSLLYVDGQMDPHVWMDVSLWEKSIPLIVQALSDFDPDNQALYQERGQELSQQMLRLHQEIYDELQSVPEPQRYLVTCHDAFNYFTKTYLAPQNEQKADLWQKRCKAPEGLAPDSQLSITDIQEVVSHLKHYNIEVVFPESTVSSHSITKIKEASKKLGIPLFVSPYVLYADSLGEPGSGQETYLQMIRYNAEVITKCLKSKANYETKNANCS